MNYTYLTYKDVHSITNGENLDITYKISKVTSDFSTLIHTGIIKPNATEILKFKTDGFYSVTLTTIENTATPPIEIKYFNNTLTSYISSSESTLCGCTPCKDCKDCNECEDYLSTILRGISFTALMAPTYGPYLDLVMDDIKTEISDEVLCNLLEEKVHGKAGIKKLVTKIISGYYLGFFYKDLALAFDEEERDYVKKKYKAEKIFKCLSKIEGFPPVIIEPEPETEDNLESE
jgi:hypothetical protein